MDNPSGRKTVAVSLRRRERRTRLSTNWRVSSVGLQLLTYFTEATALNSNTTPAPPLPPKGEIARPDQHSEALRHEFLRDLKSDSLIAPGYQGDAFVSHSSLLFVSAATRPRHRPFCGADLLDVKRTSAARVCGLAQSEHPVGPCDGALGHGEAERRVPTEGSMYVRRRRA